MAPPARPPRVHISTQSIARSPDGQDYNPGWLLAQPVTIRDQQLDRLVHTPNVPDQRQTVQSYMQSQQQARPSVPARASRRPWNHLPDDETYARSVQEQLYSVDDDPTPLSREQHSLTNLPANSVDRSLAGAEVAVNLQHGIYTVEEPRARGGFSTSSVDEIARPRHPILSQQQREALEVEEHYELEQGQIYNTRRAEQSRRQEALWRPSYATNSGYQHEHLRAEPDRTREDLGRPSRASSLSRRQIYQPDFPNDVRGARDTTIQGRQRPQIISDLIQNTHRELHTQSTSLNEVNAKPVSKRASKAAKVLEEHGQDTELGADNQAKGLVQFNLYRNSQVQWRDNDGDNWRPAVYHYQLRRKYVVQQDPHDRFDVPRAKGADPYDVTTYLGLWKHWRPTRTGGWQGIQADVLNRFERDGYPVPNYTPECLMDEGRIVLDLDNHPVKNWRELPLCLSSALDGSDIETVRRINPGITLLDIRARMPRNTLTGPRKDKVTPLFGLTALGNRTVRFRERNACPSWLERTGSDRLKDFVWSLMSQQQRNANSTQGLGMLTELQLAEFKEQTKGKFLERAGSRALPDEERKERHAADAEKLSRLREEAGPQQERSSKQRKRNYTASLDNNDEDEVQFLGSKQRKTPRNTSSVEQQVNDELEALFPSREAEDNLDVSYLSYPSQHQPLPDSSRNPKKRKQSRYIESNSEDDLFLPELKRHRHEQPSYAQEDPFVGPASGASTYGPPILYPARSKPVFGMTANSTRSAANSGGRNVATLGNTHDSSLSSFHGGYDPIPDSNRISDNRKRPHSDTRALDDEPSDPEPKRRGSIQRSRLRDKSSAGQDVGVLNSRPPFPHGRSRRYNSVAQNQRPTLHGLTELSPPPYAENRQQYSVRASDHSLNNENSIVRDNGDYSNNRASIASVARDNDQSLNEQLVSDALFYGDEQFFVYDICDSADAAPKTSESENHQRLQTSSPLSMMENTSATILLETNNQQQQASEEDMAQGDFHVGTLFEIREDTPESHQEEDVSHRSIGLENTMEDDAADSDKENQVPTPQVPQSQGSLTTGAETTQTSVISLDDVQLDNVVSGSDLEAALLRNLFDLEAAASGEPPPSLDYRFVEPHSDIDERLINVALWYTLAELSWWTGATVTTTQRNSYQSQYEEIQAAFVDLWLLETPTPQLVRLGPWYTSFENHPLPDMTIEHFNELLLALPENAPPWRHPGDI